MPEKIHESFRSMWLLYFMIFYNLGILPVNIEELLKSLPGITRLGVGIIFAGNLMCSTASVILFGYFSEKIALKFSRKHVFTFINLIWIISFGLVALSPNYYVFLIFYIIAAIGHGSFVPIGYSMISDYFPPEHRGNRYGFMEFGLTIGNGTGIIFGGLLGNYGGVFGWRIAYGLGAFIGFLCLVRYIFQGVEPERGSAEPAFQDFKGNLDYNYRITRKELISLLRKKTIFALILSMLFTGIAMSTISNWAIYYFTLKLRVVNADFYATTIYLVAGIGALPGTLIGGRVGDKYVKSGNNRGKVKFSMITLFLGIAFFMGFYLTPINPTSILELVMLIILIIILGFLGFFLTTLRLGNIQSIYSDVCEPEKRSTAIALNGLMFNIGGIMGNLLLS
ncbi:MAG: MFS transporter, partial [Promethearchaeota archaeon]